MQQPKSKTIALDDDVVITEELLWRSPRKANLQAENQAMRVLAQQMVNASASMLPNLLKIALELCSADSVGVSLLETIDGEEVLRSHRLAGRLSQFAVEAIPRNLTPWGVCLDRGTPQLFAYFERYFTYLQPQIPIVEALVLPLIAGDRPFGTIWLMSHTENRHFDAEDVRVMSSLADFTAALLVKERQTQELLIANAQLETLQERNRVALEAAKMATWDWNLVANTLTWNEQHYRLLGLAPTPKEEPLDLFTRIVHPDDLALVWEQVEKAIAQNSIYQAQFRIIRVDTGEVRWMNGYGRVAETQNGKATRLAGVMYDVTERHKTAAALRCSEERLRLIVRNVPGGAAFVVDRNLRYLLAEGEALSAAGCKSADLVGRTIAEVMPPELVPHHEALYRQGLAGESFEREHAAHDRWYISRGTPLRSENGEVYAVLAISYDITDRKRRELNAALLDEISKDLALLSAPDEIIQTVGSRLGEFMQVSGCIFADVDEAKNEATIHHGWNTADVPSLKQTFRLADYFGEEFRRAGRAREAVIVRDTAADERADAEAYARLQLGGFVTVPFHWRGRWTANITVTSREPRDWRSDEIELLQEIANRVFPRIERARAEAALRASEEKYRSLFESINDGYCVIEMIFDRNEKPIDYRFLETSPSFEQQTGLANALGKRMRELAPDHEEYWFETYGNVALSGQSVRFENYARELQRWFEVYAFSVGELEDRQVAVVFSVINDRKQAQANQIQLIREQSAREQERQRAETLAELDRAKTTFFSNVSHEFRTPLTLLLGPLQEMLSDRTLPPIHRERLELAHRNSLRLLKLVNTLLDFSRIESGRMEAVYEPTDLSTFTSELASVFRSAIEQAGLQFMVDCLPLPEAVYVDREMWEKIVLNLISNAFKFTLRGEIAVRLHPVDSHVILEVQDTGTGIAPEDVPHLFERFYQVRLTQARTHEGSGIGLALVHELVQLQGGTIDVSSTLGEGSCFTIALPFGTEHLPPERIKASRTLTSNAIGAVPYVQEAELWQASDRETPANARVLVVDDNTDMRDYLTRILSDRVEVEAVADGAAALLAAQTRVPDLILSDVMMPGLDGFGLLQALRADSRTKEIPIILLSARAGEEAIVEGLAAGADDYLIKPFAAAELVSRVNAHLQMAQLRSQSLRQERTLNQRKDELLSVVSHELNTPLVSILGWTRLLRANPPSSSMLAKALDIIERNATLQAKLVQDLLDISRITAGKLRLSLEPVELTSIIASAIATVSQIAQDKAIDLIWQPTIAPDETNSLVVMGDRDRLEQVICNLLTNAIKFTPQSGSVTVELLADTACVQIRVTDTGIGIAADFLPCVFDRFRQAATDAAKGLGLGLAIARHLVELHDGTIAAQSDGVGHGATFVVRLPRVQQ